jgi:hypothetical protein
VQHGNQLNGSSGGGATFACLDSAAGRDHAAGVTSTAEKAMSTVGFLGLWFASGVGLAALWSIASARMQSPRQEVIPTETLSATTMTSEVTVFSASHLRPTVRVQPLTVTMAGKFVLDFTDLESMPLLPAQHSTSPVSWSLLRSA